MTKSEALEVFKAVAFFVDGFDDEVVSLEMVEKFVNMIEDKDDSK